MVLSDALALCPLLQTSKATPKTDARKLAQLANWCERYSPLSNRYDKNSLWIDVTGTGPLFKGEENLLEKIRQDFINLGYTAKLALASNFGAAFAFAHFAFDNGLPSRIIPQNLSFGELQDFLSPLPAKALRLSPEILSLLHRLGLRTIGHLMDLPRETLKCRFPSREQAKSVLLRLDQILGLRDEPLAPLTPPAVFSCRLRFAEALHSRQMLEQALIRLIADLTRQLEVQKQGARKLCFILWRLDGSTAHIRIGTAHPCRDKSHIFNLFKEKMDRIEPGFGIDTIGLVVDRADPLLAIQSTLESHPQQHVPISASFLIDRLSNRLGEQKTGYLHALESHIPERAQCLTKVPPPESSWPARPHDETDPGPASCDRPFLLLALPEPIEVMAPLPDDPPLLFTWRRVTRKVMASTGPERITPEWWHELEQQTSRPRDYYKVSTNEGGTFWLYRDGLYQGEENATAPPQWYMHGFFG